MNRYTLLPVAPVNGCRYCGVPLRVCDDPGGLGHDGQHWTPVFGFHNWTVPTTRQIKGRMHARRALNILQKGKS